MADTAHLAAAWDDRVAELTGKLPRWLGSAVIWLRNPSRRLVRVMAAGLFILGGVLSILPILGIWMLPLGLSLLAEDVPGMKPPLEKSARWLSLKWQGVLKDNERMARSIASCGACR